MSRFNDQIDSILSRTLSCENGELSAQIQFDEKFVGFQGHFPDNPVLPGIVMIQVMIQMVERCLEKAYLLSEMKRAKFTEPVLAGTPVTFSVKPVQKEKNIHLQGSVMKAGKTISKISLILTPE